jgi:hypothetical protein
MKPKIISIDLFIKIRKNIESIISDPVCEHLFIVKTGAESVNITSEPPAPEKF